MSNAFGIVARFLDQTDPEVEGHALEGPPEAVKRQLRKFARGEVPDAEHRELFEQLNRNRRWLALLADEVKALRLTPGAKN